MPYASYITRARGEQIFLVEPMKSLLSVKLISAHNAFSGANSAFAL